MKSIQQMKKVSEIEYKEQILGILRRIHEVCTKYGIRYSIAFGTLIGAIRHGGFIPWDDDIDICIPREDYPAFVQAFSSEDGRFYTLDSENTRLYYNNMARACDKEMTLILNGVLDIPNLGAFVDVFFLDKWPENVAERETYKEEIIQAGKRVKYSLPMASYATLTLSQRIKKCLRICKRIYNCIFIGLDKRKKEKNEVLLKYSNSETGWRSVSFDDPNRTPWFMKEDKIGDVIPVQFEHIEVFAPADYDELLRNTYGDYMKLPPEEKRIPHHHFTAYWTE